MKKSLFMNEELEWKGINLEYPETHIPQNPMCLDNPCASILRIDRPHYWGLAHSCGSSLWLGQAQGAPGWWLGLKDGGCKMVDGETTSDGILHDSVIRPDLFYLVVGGDYYLRWTYCHAWSFDWCFKTVVVSPYFKMVTEPGVFKAYVIKDYSFTGLVSIPPDIERFVIGGSEGMPSIYWLACSWWSKEPMIIELG